MMVRLPGHEIDSCVSYEVQLQLIPAVVLGPDENLRLDSARATDLASQIP